MSDSAALLDELRSWVETETPTHEPARVSSLIGRVGTAFGALGMTTEIIPGRDGCGDHLKVESPWGDGPGVLVLAHLDTVHPLGTLAGPLPFRIEGDRAFGPGIYDMKGGAFMALAALRRISERGQQTPLPLRFLYTSDEEIGSPTSRALIEEEGARARHVLVVEPARDGGRCVTARKGTARYTVHFRGRPAHSGARHADGRSAVLEMARQIVELEGMTDYGRGITVNCGIVSGGTAFNVIPEHAELKLDIRLPDAAATEAMLARMAALKAHDPDVSIRIEGGLNRPAFVKSAAIAGLFEQARTIAREIGFDLEDTASGGGSDGSFLAERLPVLDGIGVDGEGAHTLHEHILIPSLWARTELLTRLYRELR